MEREREEAFQDLPATVLAFEGGPRLDLRFRLDAEERHALLELELGPSFAVLTAERASAEDRLATADEAEGRARERVRHALRLEEHLAREGVAFRRVDLASADGLHREHCVAVALAQEEAAALALAHAQVERLWWDGARFWPWPGEAGAAAEPGHAPGA